MQSAKFFAVTLLSVVALSSRRQHCNAAPPMCTKDVSISGGGNVTMPTEPVVGSILKYSCPYAMRPFPVHSRVCQKNGQWSPLVNAYNKMAFQASCKPMTCVGPLEFENGQYFPRSNRYNVGDEIEFECYSGFILYGSSTRTCQANGKWTGHVPACDDESSFCRNPGVPFGARKTGVDFDIEGVVSYTCIPGLVMSGATKRTCLSTGEWTGKESDCEDIYSYDTPEDVSFALSKVTLSMGAEQSESMARSINMTSLYDTHIYLVIDASYSVGKENFDTALEFLKDLINKIGTFVRNINYSIILYATKPSLKLTVNNPLSNNPDAVIKILDDLDYYEFDESPGTNTAEALKLVRKEMALFKEQNKEKFKETRQAIILLTDGRSNVGPPPGHFIDREMNIGIPDDHLDVYVFGIGDVYKEEIEQIASQKPNEQHSFILKNYQDLNSIFDNMLKTDDKLLSQCGTPGSYRRSLARIAGGDATTIQKWPWQAMINLHEKGQSSRITFCGGSIIAPEWIVTAAHCFDAFHINVDGWWNGAVKIRIGATNKLHGHEAFPKKIIINEAYNRDPVKPTKIDLLDNDIALIQLTKPIKFGSEMRPICLPCTEETNEILKVDAKNRDWQSICNIHGKNLIDVNKNISLFVTGLGYQSKTTKASELQQAIVQYVKKDVCLKDLMQKFNISEDTAKEHITDNMLCAFNATADTCPGDSGGPLVLQKNRRWIQVGVVAGGMAKCGENIKSSFYTNVAKMMSWVKRHIPTIKFAGN